MSIAKKHLTQAEALLEARDLRSALAEFDAAEWNGPDPDHCSGGRWMASMLAGNFESAWKENDALRARGAPDEHRFWQGEDLRNKRVIVRSLHGLGDAVQMLRYAPELRKLASHVVYEVPPRFVPLATSFAGIENVITWGQESPLSPPQWDAQIEVMELPYIFRTVAADLPIASRYLHLPPVEVARAEAAMGQRRRLRVGVVWSCGDWNPTRCVPPETLQPIMTDTRLDCWSLESSSRREETSISGLRDANVVCGDGLLPLAATIANLDLVITVDTLAAHLAGALGKPAWVMLQHAADWRWMHARCDTPWYPSLRLFRQPTPGAWDEVVQSMQACLDALLRVPVANHKGC